LDVILVRWFAVAVEIDIIDNEDNNNNTNKENGLMTIVVKK
jgi:hypothetical protein